MDTLEWSNARNNTTTKEATMSIDHGDINKLRTLYEHKLKELQIAEDQRIELSTILATKERDFLIAKEQKTTELRIEGLPATLIKTTVEGKTAKFKFEYEIAKGVLDAHKANVKKIYAGIEACRSFLSMAKEEVRIR